MPISNEALLTTTWDQIQSDLYVLSDEQFRAKYNEDKDKIFRATGEFLLRAIDEGRLTVSEESEETGEDYTDLSSQRYFNMASDISDEIFQSFKRNLDNYRNQMEGRNQGIRDATLSLREAERGVVNLSLQSTEKLLARRQARLDNLNAMVQVHNQKFGSALNDKSIEILKTFANISAPTFTSIMLGWEMARQSEADRSAQAIANQAMIDDRNLKYEEAVAKFNEDVAKNQFQKQVDEATARIEYLQREGVVDEKAMNLVAKFAESATRAGVDYAQMAVQLAATMAEIESRERVAEKNVEQRRDAAELRAETALQLQEMKAQDEMRQTEFSGRLRSALLQQQGSQDLVRDFYKHHYAMSLGYQDWEKRSDLLGRRLDFEYDKVTSEENRFALQMKDRRERRDFLAEQAQRKYDAQMEVQNAITQRLTNLQDARIDAEKVMQLVKLQHRSQQQQQELDNALTILEQKGENDLRLALIRLNADARENELNRQSRLDAVDRQGRYMLERIDRLNLARQENIKLRGQVQAILDDLKAGAILDRIETEHLNSLEEMERRGDIEGVADFRRFVQNYALQNEKINLQREVALLNREAEDERLAKTIAAKRELQEAGFTQEQLMEYLRAGFAFSRDRQNALDTLTRIEETYKARGEYEAARQLRDFNYRVQLNEQEREADLERERLRINGLLQRQEAENVAEDQRLQRILDDKADERLFNFYQRSFLQDQKNSASLDALQTKLAAERGNLLTRLQSEEFRNQARLSQDEADSIRNFIIESNKIIQRGEEFDQKRKDEAERFERLLENKENALEKNSSVRLEIARIRGQITGDRQSTNIFMGNSKSALSNYIRYLEVQRKAQRDKDDLTIEEKKILENGRRFDRDLEARMKNMGAEREFKEWKANLNSWTKLEGQRMRDEGALERLNIEQYRKDRREIWRLNEKINRGEQINNTELRKLEERTRYHERLLDNAGLSIQEKSRLTERGQDIGFFRTVYEQLSKDRREFARINAQENRDSNENRLKRDQLEARIRSQEALIRQSELDRDLKAEMIRDQNSVRREGNQLAYRARLDSAFVGANSALAVEQLRGMNKLRQMFAGEAFKQDIQNVRDVNAGNAVIAFEKYLNDMRQFGPGSEQVRQARNEMDRLLKSGGLIIPQPLAEEFNTHTNRASEYYRKSTQQPGASDRNALTAALQGAENNSSTPEEKKEKNRKDLAVKVATAAFNSNISLTKEQTDSIVDAIAPPQSNPYIEDQYAVVLNNKDLPSMIATGLTNFTREQNEKAAKEAQENSQRERQRSSSDMNLRSWWSGVVNAPFESIDDSELRDLIQRYRELAGPRVTGRATSEQIRKADEAIRQLLPDLRNYYNEKILRPTGSTFESSLGEEEPTEFYAGTNLDSVTNQSETDTSIEGMNLQIPESGDTLTAGIGSTSPESGDTLTAGIGSTSPESGDTLTAGIGSTSPESGDTLTAGMNVQTPESGDTLTAGINVQTPESFDPLYIQMIRA